jgi:hypothetical protein
MKEQEDKDDGKAQGKAQANVAIATRMLSDQIKDTGFLYFTVLSYSSCAISPYAMPSITSHEYALYTAKV